MVPFWSIFKWALGTGLVGWMANYGLKWIAEQKDRNKVYDWLMANTRDEPSETHKSLFEISDGTRLPKEQVHIACRDPRIHESFDKPGHYSIWRKEPQSVYEKRGLLSV